MVPRWRGSARPAGVGLLLVACGASGGPPAPGTGSGTGGAATTPSGGAATAPSGGSSLGGTTSTGDGGIGLYSPVFEAAAGAAVGGGGTAPIACDYTTPGCDLTREAGCCEPLACDHANGADVWNTHPIEACRALLDCVQANPGCSTAADPLCFMDEDPNGPCLQQIYDASHTDADGPYAWTLDLMRCLCGY
jgi:hypothetical protein